jgi:hypothetical protein
VHPCTGFVSQGDPDGREHAGGSTPCPPFHDLVTVVADRGDRSAVQAVGMEKLGRVRAPSQRNRVTGLPRAGRAQWAEPVADFLNPRVAICPREARAQMIKRSCSKIDRRRVANVWPTASAMTGNKVEHT